MFLQRGDEELRIEVLRRIPLEDATSRRDIIWAKTKKNGNGNGNGHHSSPTGPAAARSNGGNGNGGSGAEAGNGAECLIALQRLELWSSIGRWHIDEPQGAEGGGVLGALLCCYPDPQPASSPPPPAQEPTPPPNVSCPRHYPSLQTPALGSALLSPARGSPMHPAASTSSASAPPFGRF